MSRPLKLVTAWLALAACAAAALWVWQPPQGPLRGLLLLLFVPPAYLLLHVAGELLGDAYSRLPGIRHGNEFVEQRTGHRSISGLRILWNLASAIGAIALVTAATWAARTFLQL